MGDEQYVHSEEDQAAYAGEEGSPESLVCQLVPEGEIEVDTHHDLGGHDDRDYLQAFPVAWSDDVFKDVHVADHAEEGQEREYYEVLHRFGIHLLAALLRRAAEHEGFVGIAEGLGNHRHDHRDLDARAVDTKRNIGTFAVDEREHYLGAALVQDAGYSEHKDRPAVGHHSP